MTDRWGTRLGWVLIGFALGYFGRALIEYQIG